MGVTYCVTLPRLILTYPNIGVCRATAQKQQQWGLPIVGFAIPLSVGWMGVVPDLAVRALPSIEQGNFLFDIRMGDVSLMREHDGVVFSRSPPLILSPREPVVRMICPNYLGQRATLQIGGLRLFVTTEPVFTAGSLPVSRP